MITHKLDLGCGKKRPIGYIGVDSYDWSDLYDSKTFICGNIPEVLTVFEDNSIERVRASHILEHIPDIIRTFNEVYRILIPNGDFDIWVPNSTSKGAFADPTHVRFFNDMSFRYYDMTWDPELLKSYGITCDFKQIKIEGLDNGASIHAILRKRG